MISMGFLQKCSIYKTESATTGTDFLLHTHELRKITAGFFRTQFIAPPAYFLCHKTNAANTCDRPGYTKHQVDVSVYAGLNGFFYLFIRDLPFLLWII